MPSPLARVVQQVQYFESFGRFIARRSAREAADGSTLDDLTGVSLGLPAGLELEWLGTAGYRITYEGHTLLIDPYLSRVPLGAAFSRSPALPDLASAAPVLSRELGVVDGILIGHTHFDHAIDVPLLCRELRCHAYGSASLVHLMQLHGLGDQAEGVVPHAPYELGPFIVSFVPSVHSKLLLGWAVPSDGALSCEHLDELSPGAYKCGPVYGIRIQIGDYVIYHQGSANLIDSEVPAGGVDLFLAGIAGRSFTDRYWERILTRLDPAVVLAGHFDDFFRPLGDPLGFVTNVNLSGLPDEVAAVSRDIKVAAQRPLAPVRG